MVIGDRPELAEGLAALAVSDARMGATESEAHSHLLRVMQNHAVTNAEAPTLLDAAVVAVAQYAPEEVHDPTKAERLAHMQRLVGADSTEHQLTALMQAREWLHALAAIARESG